MYRDLKYVKFDPKHNTFYDYGLSVEGWCVVSGGFGRDLCSRPDPIPAKDQLKFSLREGVLRERNWSYLVGAIYVTQKRVLERLYDDIEGKTHYLFNCAAPPFTPPGMKVVMHNGKRYAWDFCVEVYSPHSETNSEFVRGYDYLKKLAGRQALDATTLEYLLSNPYLIPLNWRKPGMQILFPGTIYGNELGVYHCGLLFSTNGRWCASIVPLDTEWANNVVAAIKV